MASILYAPPIAYGDGEEDNTCAPAGGFRGLCSCHISLSFWLLFLLCWLQTAMAVNVLLLLLAGFHAAILACRNRCCHSFKLYWYFRQQFPSQKWR